MCKKAVKGTLTVSDGHPVDVGVIDDIDQDGGECVKEFEVGFW